MLLPCEDNLLRNITLDRPSFRVGRFDSLPGDIEHAVLDVFEKELDLQRRLEILKRDLECRYDYSALAAYRSVDKYNDGRIDTYNLGSFLRSAAHYATERELLAIVRRIDTDGDARLSYSEFADFVRSQHPPARGAMASSDEASRAASASRSRGFPMTQSSPLRPSSPPRAHSASHGRGRLAASSPYRSPQRSPVRESSPLHCPTHRCSSPARKPILHLHEEDELVRGLREMISLEREIETSKTSLTLKSDFNLVDAFKIFDINYRGAVGSTELREGLSAIGVYPTQDEVDLFITRYDKSGCRRLSSRDFGEAFLAHDSYYASMLNRRGSNYRNPCYRRDDCFYSDSQIEFRNVWRVHFRAESAAEAIRQRLTRQSCFNVYEAFNSCDLNDDGQITQDELKRLIQSRGFFVSEKEASQVTDKFDKSKFGRISYSQVSLRERAIGL